LDGRPRQTATPPLTEWHRFESWRMALAASRSILGAGGTSVNEANTLRARLESPEGVRSRGRRLDPSERLHPAVVVSIVDLEAGTETFSTAATVTGAAISIPR
jgi:hypothetical protein